MEKATVGVGTVDPVTDNGWAALADRAGSLFTSAPWLGALADGYGMSFQARVFGDRENPRGGVAWSEISDVRGRRIVSLPFSDFADPIGEVAGSELADLANELVSSGLSTRFRFLHVSPDENSGLAAKGAMAWHRADLPTSDDALWDAIKSQGRQNIRKARKSGLSVNVFDGVEGLALFRQLHVVLRKRKYRLLAQPRKFFDALATHYAPDNLRVVIGYLDDEPVSGIVLLRHGDTAYYKFNASTDKANQVRANDFVMWEAMTTAIAWGCTGFDFGVSSYDQKGLISYKKKYATESGEMTNYRANGDAPLSTVERFAGSTALPALTRWFTHPRVPDLVTSRAGDLLYRQFS